MSGLVGYASSDEDEDSVQEQPEAEPTKQVGTSSTVEIRENRANVPLSPLKVIRKGPKDDQKLGPLLGPQIDPDALKDAPVLGPRLPSEHYRLQAMMNVDVDVGADGPASLLALSRPSSPYSATRALLRDLTLPAVPNLNLPPSPPGTPPPGLASLTARFETFLELKRTKGTHFNSRLAQSTAMRNPALMDKLLDFVGFADPEEAPTTGAGGAADQYATVLPRDLWDPTAFPDWAFRGELRRAQEKVQKEREAERASGRRDTIEFVSASSASSGGAAAATAGSKRKTRFEN